MTDLGVPVHRPVTLVDDGEFASSWTKQLDGSGAQVIEVDLAGVRDKDGFIQRTNDGLGLEDEARARGWDGLADRLWEVLGLGEADTAVIVLRNIDDLVAAGLGVVLDAVRILGDLRRQVGGESESFSHQLDLYVVATGTGPSFPAGV